MTFPKLIHVTREGEGNDAYWEVHEHGVADLDVPRQPVAIYQLVKVGAVAITKAFVDQPRKRRR